MVDSLVDSWQFSCILLTQLPLMLHICISIMNQVSIGSDDGFSPSRCNAKPMLGYCQLDPKEHNFNEIWTKYKTFHSRKCIWK